MFLTVDSDIIKSNLFPNNNDFLLKKVLLNANSVNDSSYSESLSCKFTIVLYENIANTVKVFKNTDARRYMRLKVFQIRPSKKADIEACKNIIDLEKILFDSGSKYIDIYAGYGFLGDKDIITEHYVDNNILVLSYENELIFNSKDLLNNTNKEDLILGAVFYYDYKTYINENNINEQLLNLESIFGNIQIYELLNNGVNSNISILQDLRLIKKNFAENQLTQNIFEDVINIENKTLRMLGNEKILIPANTYFSNLYLSSNINGQVTGMVNIDFKQLVLANSPYKKYIENSGILEEILNNATIKNVNILRRKVKKINKNKIIPIDNDFYSVVSSGEVNRTLGYNNASNLISPATGSQDPLNNISEKNVDVGPLNNTIRGINFTDNNVKNSSNKATYQYGIEIQFYDSYKVYLEKIYQELTKDIQSIKEYLNQTNNIVKTKKYEQSLTTNISSLVNGYFDPLLDKFTFAFCYSPDSPWNMHTEKALPYSERLLDISSRFAATCDFLGLIKYTEENKEQAKKDFISSIYSLVNCINASSKSINYCLKLFEKISHQIQKIIKANKNSKLDVIYWFRNIYYTKLNVSVNAESRIIGASFFEKDIIKYDKDLGSIAVNELKSYFDFEKKLYGEIGNNTTKISLTPYQIFSSKKYVTIESDDNKDFTFLDSDIKEYKLIDNSGISNIPDTEITNNPFLLENDQDYRKKNNNILNSLSLTIENNYIDLSNKYIQPYKQEGLNELVIPTYIQKAINESYDLNNKKLKISETKKTLNVPNDNSIPFQIFNLLKNVHANGFLNPTNVPASFNDLYFNLDSNSKIKTLFNSIYKVQYLTYKVNVKEESWIDLDINSIPSVPVLCRLKLFNDSSLINNVVSFNSDVLLPVINEYFILSNTNEIFSPRQIHNITNISLVDSSYSGQILPAAANSYLPTIQNIINTSVEQKIVPRPPLPPAATLSPTIAVIAFYNGSTAGNEIVSGYRMGEDVSIKYIKQSSYSNNIPLIFKYSWYIDNRKINVNEDSLIFTIPIDNQYLGKKLKAKITVYRATTVNSRSGTAGNSVGNFYTPEYTIKNASGGTSTGANSGGSAGSSGGGSNPASRSPNNSGPP